MNLTRRALLLAPLLLTTAFAAGCDEVVFVDTVDLELDFFALEGPSDALHEPYVLGAQLTVIAHDTDDDTDHTCWVAESETPSVLQVVTQGASEDDLSVTLRAVGEGDAVLAVYAVDGDRRRHVASRTLSVRAPDAVRFLEHGTLMVLGDADEARVSEVNLLTGGRATFLVEYLRDGVTLHGNRALFAEADAGLEAEVRETFLFEQRDWLTVSALEEGVARVRVGVAGSVVGELTVRGVSPLNVAWLDVVGDSERHRDDGELLYLLARAWSVDGDRLLGVEYRWTLDGVDQGGLGDIFRYAYARGHEGALRARHVESGSSVDVTVHAESGDVLSSNDLGCRSAPGAPSAWVLLGLGAWAIRRRRAA